VPLGSLTALIYIISCNIKVCHGISFACPVMCAKFKKSYWKIPRDFAHYENEFDFGCERSLAETL
jgi:hypothetical protein